MRLGFPPPRALKFVLTGLLLCVPANGGPGPAWIELRSSHFNVITNAGEKKGREVAVRFEQMRAVFGTLLLKQRLNQPAPITVLAFTDEKLYYQAAPVINGKPVAVPGFTVTADDRIYFVLNLSEPEPWRAVARDFARLFLDANYPPAQPWFDEGLREYFASVQADDKQIRIGSDPELYAEYSAKPTDKPLTELLNSQPWVPMADLLSTAPSAAGENQHPLFTAESWMLIHYLIHSDKLPDAGTYFDLALNRHMAADQACAQAFSVTPDQLMQAVNAYFHSLTALQTAWTQAQQHVAPQAAPAVYQFLAQVGPDDLQILVNPMTDADARALAAGIMITFPERRQQGLDQLHQLASTPDPSRKVDEKAATASAIGNALAHRWLAFDALQRDQFDEAARELGNAAALDQHDVWVRYDLSVLKARIAESSHKDIQGLANMMIDLRTVLEAFPDTASAYDLLAQARLAGGGNVTAMQTERTAMQLAPRNQLYPLHLARIYAAAKQWDAARALLDRLKTSADARIASQAKDILDQMASNEKFGRGGVSTTSKNAEQPSPFDVLNEDAAKRAAATQPRTVGRLGGRDSRYLKGRILSLDCSHPPSAILSIAAGDALYKLRVADTSRLPVIGAAAFSCDWANKNVAVNYVPGEQNEGDVLSLELH